MAETNESTGLLILDPAEFNSPGEYEAALAAWLKAKHNKPLRKDGVVSIGKDRQ